MKKSNDNTNMEIKWEKSCICPKSLSLILEKNDFLRPKWHYLGKLRLISNSTPFLKPNRSFWNFDFFYIFYIFNFLFEKFEFDLFKFDFIYFLFLFINFLFEKIRIWSIYYSNSNLKNSKKNEGKSDWTRLNRSIWAKTDLHRSKPVRIMWNRVQIGSNWFGSDPSESDHHLRTRSARFKISPVYLSLA